MKDKNDNWVFLYWEEPEFKKETIKPNKNVKQKSNNNSSREKSTNKT